MQDLLHKALNSSPQVISKERFSKWKHDPVTEALFAALTLATLEQFEDALPESDPQAGMCLAYKRDGARELLDILAEWSPEIGEEDND